MSNRIDVKRLDKSKVMTFCKYYARKTIFEERAHYDQKDIEGINIYVVNKGNEWSIIQCVGCLRMQLIRRDYTTTCDDFGVAFANDSTILLYPTENASLSGLPDVIAKEYQAALKVRDVSLNACAVLVRRTLEVICKYENAEGKTLMGKIENLIQSNRIPPLLADMAHLGRKIGNLGAHVTDDEVTDDDVATLLDFVEAILEYLYIAPQKIAALKARLDKTS